MKSFCIVLCAAVALAVVDGQGVPTKNCGEGEHSVLYCPPKAEPDCNIPTVHYYSDNRLRPCGVPECFCDSPTVRDPVTKRCVPVAECPQQPKGL